MREWLTEVWRRLAAGWQWRQLDQDLEDEIAFHLAMREESLRERAHPPGDPAAAAERQFGNTLRVKESVRELWGWGAIERLWHDLRFGARLSRRQPAFTALVVCTLALGIGATTAMFTIVDAVMLRPFPLPDPNRVVVVWETNRERGVDRNVASVANFVDWQQAAAAFAALGAFEERRDNRTDGVEAEQIRGATASAAFFRALGLQPASGRFFLDGEDTPAKRHVAVLGHDYWRRNFNADPAAVGRSLIINSEPHTIVGVMPPLREPFVADVWRPLAPDAAQLDRGDHSVVVVGRLARERSMEEAEAELQTVAARLEAAHPQSNSGWSVRVESLFDAVVRPPTRRSMLLLMGAVGVLLLIACVNVASLMLARGTSRMREVSTRLALGASRGRVVRQLLVESGLLSLMGGAAGLLVAVWSLRLAEWIYPQDIGGIVGLELNGLAMLFAALVAAGATILVGVVPALQLSRARSDASLTPATRTTTEGAGGKRLRHGLVVAEVALAMVLLVGAGLLLRSVERLRDEPLGFVPENVLTAKIGLYGKRYESVTAYNSFIDGLVADLGQRPGVAAAGISSSIPFAGGYTVMQVRLNGAGPELETGVQSQWRVIGGNYFDAMGIPLKAGRPFDAGDHRQRAVRATIINETLAERLWPGQDVIGRHILVGDARRPGSR